MTDFANSARRIASTLRAATAALAGIAALTPPGALAAEACKARSGDAIAPVVELYTSEGCSSCPPADKWLSRLKADPDVVALAFHVDYWDRLGWKDRFASAAWTERQSEQQRVNGARFSYTPQVVVDGRDRSDWPSIGSAIRSRAGAPVGVALERSGGKVIGTVTARANAPKRLAAFWAVTEQGHRTSVRAGENQGATLEHDFVVRTLRPVAAWSSTTEARTLDFDLPAATDDAHARQVNLVVVDADTGKPVQALKIGC